MAQPIETIFEDDELCMRWRAGTGRSLVVVFTGLQHGIDGQAPDEFAAAAYAKGRNNLLFVSDLTQSWYSKPGLWARIVHKIRSVTEVEETEELHTIGNSMGGYGALLLPRDLPVRRALAFSPQVSMHGDVISDDRWKPAQANIVDLPERNVADTIDATKTYYFVTAGAEAKRDRAHMALLPEHARLHAYILQGGGHDIARRLKAAGVLPGVVAAMLRGRTARVTQLFDDYHAWLARAEA